jgi:glycosyltransferase involved in cell wall biosynthesis
MANVKITFLVPAYNEVARIGMVLEHATRWADEVVVMDKGSTDGTLDLCHRFGDRVRVVPIPFSERSHENFTLIPGYVSEGWVFFGTCSEIPTHMLIEKCREALEARGDELDLLYVPRLMYFFGVSRAPENGGVSYYPFLFHRDRVVITNDINDNFHASDPARTLRIPYEPDCCVHHFTHPTVRSFWLSSLTYFSAEVQKDGPPEKVIREAFKGIEKLSRRVLMEGENWIPFYCALASYELGRALSVWEKAQGPPGTAAKKYMEMSQELLGREWTAPVSVPTASAAKFANGVRIASGRALKPLIVVLSRFPYLVLKLSMAFRKFKITDD